MGFLGSIPFWVPWFDGIHLGPGRREGFPFLVPCVPGKGDINREVRASGIHREHGSGMVDAEARLAGFCGHGFVPFYLDWLDVDAGAGLECHGREDGMKDWGAQKDGFAISVPNATHVEGRFGSDPDGVTPCPTIVS